MVKKSSLEDAYGLISTRSGDFLQVLFQPRRYTLKIKKPILSKRYYENAKTADPLHPSILFLERKFSKNRTLQLFHKLSKHTYTKGM